MRVLLPQLIGPIARNLLRYLIGLLVGAGWLASAQGETIAGDPAVQAAIVTILGAVAAGVVEWIYNLARKWGYAT